jgi:hypothetical protein
LTLVGRSTFDIQGIVVIQYVLNIKIAEGQKLARLQIIGNGLVPEPDFREAETLVERGKLLKTRVQKGLGVDEGFQHDVSCLSRRRPRSDLSDQVRSFQDVSLHATVAVSASQTGHRSL